MCPSNCEHRTTRPCTLLCWAPPSLSIRAIPFRDRIDGSPPMTSRVSPPAGTNGGQKESFVVLGFRFYFSTRAFRSILWRPHWQGPPIAPQCARVTFFRRYAYKQSLMYPYSTWLRSRDVVSHGAFRLKYFKIRSDRPAGNIYLHAFRGFVAFVFSS